MKRKSAESFSSSGAGTHMTGEPAEGEAKMPQKRFFRMRAHCNPLSHNDGFNYPVSPAAQRDGRPLWELYYPQIQAEDRVVRNLDIGMGFGGLTVALAQIFPRQLVMGMEIRAKVCEYVRLRIEALRQNARSTGSYQNAACLRTNCMRYLPNFFLSQQLYNVFVCFPDPHFKAKNHRRRIISEALLTEYAYLLRPGGRIFAVTDVLELHNWHVEKLEAHPLFAPIPTEELEVLLNVLGPIPPEAEHSSAVEDTDVSHRYLGVSEVEFDGSEKATTADALALRAILAQTEESKKVGRLGGKKYFAVYRRLSDDECLGPSLSSEGSNTHGLPALFAPPATSAWQELWN